MAKRRIRAAELAGLAALGAFGHTFFGPGRDRKPYERPASEVPVDYRGTDLAPAVSSAAAAAQAAQAGQPAPVVVVAPPVRQQFSDLQDMHQGLGPLADTGGMGRSEVAAKSQENMPPPAVAAPVVMGGPAAAAAPVVTRGLSPAAGTVRAAPAVVRGMGDPGYTQADIDAYRRRVPNVARQEAMRGHGLGRVDVDPRSRPVVPRSRPMTREELINQIPTGGNATATGGRQVTGNEFSRNMANILAAFGPTRLAGFGNAAVEAATARGALQRASAAQAARTDAARRGQTPTNLKSTKSTSTARANEASKRTKKFDEEEANVEFKRGGKTSAKPKKMASGGMSSASKRGDGIASKGKTKCKMY